MAFYTRLRSAVPWPARIDRPVRRLTQLYAGLVLYGLSDSMIVLAGLGVDPWDVLHQGLSRHTGIPIGTWAIIVGALVLLCWIPLRQRPGLGTVSNVVLIGLVMDLVLGIAGSPHGWPARVALLTAGIVLNGFATGCYIGARFGPGPRDGLMTGLAARGHSIRVVRTSIELSVLTAGWLLGGSVGIGTVCYALAIGPLAHVFIPLLRVPTGRQDAGTAGHIPPSSLGSATPATEECRVRQV